MCYYQTVSPALASFKDFAMRTTHSISITLPTDMARMVEAKVASGEYASESEVIRDGLRILQARDAQVEEWLKTEVAATYDAHHRNPSGAIPIDKVMAGLERRITAAKAVKRGA